MQPQTPFNIDQNADSRIIAVHSYQTQEKIRKMNIYLSGLDGLGIQVAKNLILIGPKKVSIYDKKIVQIQDVGRNFYLHKDDIGKKTRLEASIQKLKYLNTNVIVETTTNNNIQYISQNFDCVIILDNYNKDYLIQLNKKCRDKNLGFILGGNLGLYGYTFVDFGNQHIVFDKTGQQPKSIHISGITQEQKGVVCFHDEKKHGLADGDTILFKQVKGMIEINEKQFIVQVLSFNSIAIGDTRNYSAYIDGGVAIQIKKPIKLIFNSLQDALTCPYAPDTSEMPICNWQKFGQPEQLHIILNSLYDFVNKYQSLPKLVNKDDAQKLKQLVKQRLSIQIKNKQFNVKNIEQKLIENVSFFAQTQITPCCSFWGGIIAQQVIKFTGKYTPLYQWLHHQYFQALPTIDTKRSQQKNRYTDYHILFGDEFVKNMNSINLFLVGAGALGCEFLKIFALMGFSSKTNSKLICTDDDNIEISNLNRQFLFKKQHIGKNKSKIACQICKKINNQCNFQSTQLKVCDETQQFFNDKFWQNLDIIVNAVDNIKARQYIDNKCIWYEKPLFESGTLGTKCHSQIIIPFKTITYNDIIDPPQQSIALCTLKSFPYQIQHTIQWAREYFQEIFSESSVDLVKFCYQGENYLKTIINQNKQNPSISRAKLQNLQKIFQVYQTNTYEACLQLAISIFYDIFYSQILQLITTFPQDYIRQDTNKLFWSGVKRFPMLIQFDPEDSLHLDVIQGAANILATCIGLPMEKNKNKIAKIVKNIKPIKFRKQKIQLQENKQSTIQFSQQDEEQIKKICNQLLTFKLSKNNLPSIIQFEKDDPTNYHIQFLSGVANLRARNYRIEQVDNFKIKLIAGKIIPAIITTTAVIVGAVGMQIIKYILKKDIQNFKNATINLALPLWIYNDVMPAIQIKDEKFNTLMAGPIKAIAGNFNKWQKIDIIGPVLIGQLKNMLEAKYKFKISSFHYGMATIFSKYFDGNQKQKLAQSIQQSIEKVTKTKLSKNKKYISLIVSGSTQQGIDCILPQIRYKISQ